MTNGTSAPPEPLKPEPFNAFDNIVETGKDFLGLLAYSPAQSSS